MSLVAVVLFFGVVQHLLSVITVEPFGGSDPDEPR